jgi:hypothetical protein
MSPRLLLSCFVLLAACNKFSTNRRDAAPVDTRDTGTDLDSAAAGVDAGHDAATHGAAARSGWGGLMADNPPECPESSRTPTNRARVRRPASTAATVCSRTHPGGLHHRALVNPAAHRCWIDAVNPRRVQTQATKWAAKSPRKTVA